MKRVVLVLAVLLATTRRNEAGDRKVDFAADIKPILAAKCQPCHFAGGKMYARLPFDQPATLVALGEKKLFTRIHDESQRALIRQFLAQQKR